MSPESHGAPSPLSAAPLPEPLPLLNPLLFPPFPEHPSRLSVPSGGWPGQPFPESPDRTAALHLLSCGGALMFCDRKNGLSF